MQKLRGELAAARAENEMLLQQITRLCLYIERSTGVDPIEVMHGHAELQEELLPAARQLRPAAPPIEEQHGWVRGLLSRAGLTSSSGNRNVAADRIGQGRGSAGDGDDAAAGLEDEDESPTVIAGGTFEWRGDPDAMEELERKVGETVAVAEVNLDGTGLTRLPSSLPMWQHLGRTLSQISLNGNGLVELPAAFTRLRSLRKLFLEGNLLRELPAPVLGLRRLEELGLGCNQLTGLPEAFGELTSLQELFLVSNEISYLPQSIGQLRRLRKLELSANALHELPRAFGKLRGLTHLWLSGNSLSTFPQHLCALDSLELLDLQQNAIMSIPRAVGTMPALKTLLLANNQLAFPPAGVIQQGPAAVLEYVRRHRQTDMITTDAERSLKQVLAYRNRLASSVDAHEENHRHLTMVKDAEGAGADGNGESPRRAVRGADPVDVTQKQTSPSRRARNSSFFD